MNRNQILNNRGACIVKEAGGICSDIYGYPLDFNRENSLFMNHKGIIYADTIALADQITKIYNSISTICPL